MPKYKLEQIGQEELDSFMKELHELIEKHQVYLEPVPKMVRSTLQTPFSFGADLIIHKKVLVEETDESPQAD